MLSPCHSSALCVCPLQTLATTLHEANSCPVQPTSGLVDYSVPGNRLVENIDGSIELLPKNPAFVFGERVVRPAIDSLASLCNHVWKGLKWGVSSLNTIRQKVFGCGRPAPLAPSRSITRIIRNETCPIMATWLDFTKLMCDTGGGITITPMRSHHMKPENGIVVSLRGYSKVIAAQEFCSHGRVLVEQYVKENALPLSEHLLSSDEKPYEPYFGAWYNRENEKVYLDVSVVFKENDAKKALQFARDQNQIAVYHISQGREIPAGGTGEE